MTHSPISQSWPLSALVIASTMVTFHPQSATAQTAGDVNCNGCVSSKDLQNNAIKSNDIKNGQVKSADLRDNAVTGAKVKNGSLTADDLAPDVLFGATVLVRSNGGSALANCDMLRNALADITDAGPETPVVVKLERGTYDCGATSLALVPFAAIEGAGRNATAIIGDVDSLNEGVIKGADDSALRHLTVEHRAVAPQVAIAITTGGSAMSLSDVAVKVDSRTANQVLGILAVGGSLSLTNVSVQTKASDGQSRGTRAGQSQGIRGEAGAKLSMVNTWVHNQSGAVGNPNALELRDSSATGFGVMFSSNFFGLLGRGNSFFELMDGTVIGGRGASASFTGGFTCIAIADGDFNARDPDCS